MVKVVASGVMVAVLAAGPAWAQAPETPDPVKARQKISMMEGVLERAVANGADNMFRAVRLVMPMADGLRLIGAPEVSGFRLDGFGVFFDVEVPQLLLPPSWTLRYMVDQNGLAAGAALATVRDMIPQVRDPQQRARLEQAFTRLELQVGPAEPARPLGEGIGPRLAAQSVTDAPQAAARAVASPQLEDPNVAYTREVQAAIIEAMIENSGPIGIGPDEWLIIAARDSSRVDRTVVTGDSLDVHTIMFRVKGSDLAAFRAGTLTLDEARGRVQIRED